MIGVAGRIAGLVAIVFLQTYWFLQPVPIAAKGLVAVFLGLCIWRLEVGLLAFAGLAPISTAIARFCGGGAGLGGELLEQMALGVGMGVLIRRGLLESPTRTRTGAPALVIALVAFASAAAMVPTLAAPVLRDLADLGILVDQLSHRSMAAGSPIWRPLFAALTVAECALLGWAVERILRGSPEMATRLLLSALIGNAAAAVLNLQAVIEFAMRSGSVLEALPRLLMSVRISLQTDWNASASTFLLAGISGLGLMRGSWRTRIGVGVLVGLVALGVWLTGSRFAIAAGTLGVVGLLVWSLARSNRRIRIAVVGTAVLVVALSAWLIVGNPSGRNDPLPLSVAFRRVMFDAGIEMFKQAPVFGIGIDKFYEASAAFIGPFMQTVGGGPRENAHNNFVQVLAEQGVIGLAAILWWLAAITLPAARANPDLLRRALLMAVLACVGTWTTGHPLLVPQFAFVFWLYCGILAGMTPAPPAPRLRLWPWIGIAILISIPFRASALRSGANLEYRGFGVSMWHHDDSQRYQEVGAAFALFLPATGRAVEVPVRLAPGVPGPLILEIRLGDRLLDKISVETESWQTALVVVPPDSRQFEVVDFVVHAAPSGVETPRVLLRIGKPLAR